MRIAYSKAATDVGRRRDKNEDSWLIDRDVFAVADGMGGHERGEVASRLAVSMLTGIYLDGLAPSEIRVALCRPFLAAHNRLLVESGEFDDSGDRGMGTTLTACAVAGSMLHVAHAGDSAAFLVRGGAGRRLTTDHSVGHGLLNGLGVTATFLSKVEYGTHPLCAGDIVVLCTDGLTNYADENRIAQIAGAGAGRPEAALVQFALDSGGQDNVTAVVVGVA